MEFAPLESNQTEKKMITYKHKYHQKVTVKMDGKTVGSIILTGHGWQYRPKGATSALWGPYFKSLSEIKKDLEGE